MKLSVVIPVYNIAEYLRECLDSLLVKAVAASDVEMEILCVDDGSADESSAILDEYAAHDSRVRVVHQPNAGVSAARNQALDIMSGDWFTFVDGDDSVNLGAMMRIVQDADQRGVDCAFCGAESEVVTFGYPFNKFFRRSVYGGLRFIEGMRYREDMCYWAEALALGGKMICVSDVYYNYRVREGSASGTVNARAFRDLLYCPVHVLKYLGSRGVEFVKQERSQVNGVAHFALERWGDLNVAQRKESLSLMNETCRLSGFNPYDGWVRLARRFSMLPGIVRSLMLAYRVVHKVKRILKCA